MSEEMIEDKKKKAPKLSKLQKQELKLLNQIEEMGLVRHVEHMKYHPPHRVQGEHTMLEQSYETSVELYNADSWNNINKDREDGKIDKFPREMLTPVGIGFARCSVKDQFNRKVGRVIATTRALRSFLNSEASN